MKTIIVVCTYLLMVASCFAHDYSCREERACRCSNDRSCDYDTIDGLTRSQCKSRCDNDSGCQGYEWTNNSDNSSDENRCEIHYVRGNNFSHSSQNRDNTVCCWRVSTMNSKGGRRLDPVSRRQVSGHGRDRARKHRRQAVRIGQIGQKMDAPNARR